MEEAKFKIITDGNSLDQMTSEFAFGPIFFDTGRSFFPERDWTDFPLVIISWFAKALVEMPMNIDKQFEVDFLEGPFKLKIKLNSMNYCIIDLIEGENLAGSEESVIQTLKVQFNSLLKQVMSICIELLKAVDTSKDLEKSSDYENLRKAHNLLVELKTQI